jgi:hypothetical protein
VLYFFFFQNSHDHVAFRGRQGLSTNFDAIFFTFHISRRQASDLVGSGSKAGGVAEVKSVGC